MNYYPSKCEIYSILLKKHIINKLKSSDKNDVLIKRLAKIKLYEALIAPLYCEPTDLLRFIENLFLRIESVCAAKGKNVILSVKGEGCFFVDRRCLTYFILELAAANKVVNIEITDFGFAVNGVRFTSDLRLLSKKLSGIVLQNKIGIPLRASHTVSQKRLCGVLECLENEFSPEYLWL